MKRYSLLSLLIVTVLGSGTQPASSQDGVIISELLAMNTSAEGLADEDGDLSDWIEFYNAGEEAVNLEGFWLTDDLENLRKWEFPAVELAAGSFLVIFASEKDRRDPDSELHTNFKLDRQSELLALLTPDGATVVAGFAPSYPPQVADASFGIGTDSRFLRPLTSEAAVRVLVPTDGSLGDSWTARDFDDSGWRAGLQGVGLELSPGGSRSYDELINTDVEAEMHEQNASVYIRSEFSVEDVEGVDTMTLKMKFDDGFIAYLNGVEVASANAPPAEERAWNATATRSHSDTRALEFVEFDISDARDTLVAEGNVLAIHGLNFSAGSGDMLILAEVEAVDIGPIDLESELYFAEPTPGGPNGPGFETASPDPVFSVGSGAYVNSLELELSSPVEGGTVRFTTSGQDPTEESTAYTEPLTINAATEVRARVYLEGALPGHVVTETYMVIDSALAERSSDVPIVLLDTFGRGINDSAFTGTYCHVLEVGEDGRARVTDEPDFSGRGGLKQRGSSSAGFPKKQWSFEIWDDQNEDRNDSILGMPSHSDWILQAPYSDKSLMRNVLSYQWSNWIGRYAVRTRFCEVYLNSRRNARISTNGYVGVYVFMEKIKRDSERVAIERLLPSHSESPEVEGGYILKKDRLDPGDSGFRTSRGQHLAYYYPKERDITSPQSQYIRNYINQFEGALYGANFRDPEEGYARFIDVGSFIDHHIMVEVTKNIDGYRLSTFMYKPRGGVLHMGPIWDYNLSLGNANYLQGENPAGWYYPLINSDQYPWYPRLFQDPAFVRAYRDRWVEIRNEQFTFERLLSSVEAHAATITESQARNFQRWRILGTYVWPNAYIAPTWDAEIVWMSNWIENRINWMDSQLARVPSPPEFSQEGGEIEPGFQLEITSSSDESSIYYTVDGTDPRGPRAVVGENAILYEGPVTLEANTRVIARVLEGTQFWSNSTSEIFVTEFPTIRITEIMYNPPEPTPDEDPSDEFSKSDFEFLEILNIGKNPFDLAGSGVSRGVTLSFEGEESPTLGPGEYGVLVRDVAAFESRYGDDVNVLGQYTGSLSDRSETVVLEDSLGIAIHQFAYRDSWYPETDGDGYSLVIRDANGDLELWEDAEGWMRGAERLGTPGGPEPDVVGGLQLPGDLTQEGTLDLTDGIRLLDYLFRGTPTELPCGDGLPNHPANLALLDSDGNGAIHMTDAVYVLTFLFLNGPEPVLGRECVQIDDCENACISE